VSRAFPPSELLALANRRLDAQFGARKHSSKRQFTAIARLLFLRINTLRLSDPECVAAVEPAPLIGADFIRGARPPSNPGSSRSQVSALAKSLS